jgi:hypothetical protein
VVDEAQTVEAGQESARFHTHGGREFAVGRAAPRHAAVAAIKSGIDRGELEDIVAEPLDEHVDLLGTSPVSALLEGARHGHGTQGIRARCRQARRSR